MAGRCRRAVSGSPSKAGAAKNGEDFQDPVSDGP